MSDEETDDYDKQTWSQPAWVKGQQGEWNVIEEPAGNWKAEQLSLDGTLKEGHWCGQQEGASQGQRCCFAIKDSETAADTHQGSERVGSQLSAYSWRLVHKIWDMNKSFGETVF